MFKIKTYNKISKSGLEVFDDKYTIGDEVDNADGAIVRSAALHDEVFPESLKAIARAGAGTNNIPIEKCSEQGIVVFNTPGANANAVKELVLAGLLISSRRVISGIEWAKTLKGNGADVGKMVEKGKSAFTGPEIKGKTLGVIGLGANLFYNSPMEACILICNNQKRSTLKNKIIFIKSGGGTGPMKPDNLHYVRC